MLFRSPTLNRDAMAKLLLLALIGSASALVLPTARAGVTAARVPAMTMISMPFGNNAREYEECVVDAENAAELAACMDGSVTQSGVAATAAPNPLEAIGAFFSRFMKRDLDVDVALAAISDQVAYYAVPSVQDPGFLEEGSEGSTRCRMGTLCRVGAGRCGLMPDKASQKCARRPHRREEDNNGRSTATFALG